MMWPVAILALLSLVGGWIQFAGVWTPVSNFLNPVVPPLVEASGTQELVSSLVAVALGLAGIGVAWWLYGARRRAVPRFAPLQRALERKLYWDDLYDWVFYRPAAWVARAELKWFERPVIGGSATGLALGARESGELVSDTQTGFLRAYALALAAGVAVLLIVFISVK
jgi:NADH-quinone oxidoreductase subunit L